MQKFNIYVIIRNVILIKPKESKNYDFTDIESFGGGALPAYRMALSQVLFSNVIAHLLRKVEFVLKRSRTICAMAALNIQSRALWKRVSEGNENGLLQRRMSLFNDSKESRYDIESSCKTQVAGAAATLPKRTYSFINLFSYSPRKRAAFTLAEVLITLGIIGVVAALTLPALIDNHNKSVVEARLEKFYSSMNQAIRMAELDYGSRESWFYDYSDLALQEAWIKQYIVPYMNVVKTDKVVIGGRSMITIYFADGSAVTKVPTNGRDWYFFPGDPERCISSSPTRHYKDFIGRCAFAFYYNPVPKSSGNGFEQWNFEPFVLSSWTGTENDLKNNSSYGCYNSATWHGYCTRLIQYYGWKIPKDYPFRVKYR